MRKFVQRGGIAGLAVLVLAGGAVLAVGAPRSHPPKAVKSVFPAPTPVADDPLLVAAITRGGPPLTSPRVQTALVAQKTTPVPLYQSIDLDTGPANDGVEPVSRTQADAAATENAASPAEPDVSFIPAAD